MLWGGPGAVQAAVRVGAEGTALPRRPCRAARAGRAEWRRGKSLGRGEGGGIPAAVVEVSSPGSGNPAGRGRRKGGAMPVEQQPPEVLALVIADHVHQDDLTGKFFILGTRSEIGAPEFPWSQPALAVYAAL